ncbi:MAG TPA: L,D-transpeptidase [Anaerovoracaceae bacterium]|nr:L,D-transpeptidase [Anaerovoracaceae bacterium]
MKKIRRLIITIVILIGVILVLIFLLDQTNLPTVQNKNYIEQRTKEYEQISQPGEILSVEDNFLESTFNVSLEYEKYPTTYTYIYVESESIDIRLGPSLNEESMRKAYSGERLNYLETVSIAAENGLISRWYHVFWEEEGERRFGFITDTGVKDRWFQFDKMEKAILKAENYSNKGRLTYINNYQNCNGDAPLYKGGIVDDEGNRRSQSAPGYTNIDDKENFTYIEDGTLILHHLSDGKYAKIETISTGKNYYVPMKYIPKNHVIHELKRVIIVDVTNQNEAAYEKKAEGWTLISCSHATTGTTGRYSQPTPLGFFFAMEKRSFFRYYEDGTTRIQGYAPYAIRFAGGAYIHGVAVNYKYGEDGKLIAPPTKEYSSTIGTVPLSHKCVRNYTSHAKFLYDWFVPGETIVIVID